MNDGDDTQIKPVKTFAFIDKANLHRTTKDLLGFRVDWKKLADYLLSEKRIWICEKVYIFAGTNEYEVGKLTARHTRERYDAHIRSSKPQQDKTTEHPFICEDCGKEGKLPVVSRGAIKSNCDVDLTVEAMQCIEEATQFLLFTGDGDFESLIIYAMDKGIHVRIVSNTKRDSFGKKRFSTRLQVLLDAEIATGRKRASFIDINDWRKAIEKEEPPSSVAAPE